MALAPSGSLVFPFKYDNENDCMQRAFTIEEVLLASIRSFLCTRKGSRLGNNIGSFLPELLLQGIPVSKLSSLSDELKRELSNQFQGVKFISVALNREISDNVVRLRVVIKFSVDSSDNIMDLDMSLPSIFSN